MNLIRSIFLLSVLTVLSSVAVGQAEFTMQEAMEYSAENSYMMKKADMDVRIADGRVKETTGMGLPQVSGVGRFQNFLDIPTVMVPDFGGDPGNLVPAQFGTEYSMNGGMEANQLIFDGSYFVGLQAARTYRELSENAQQKTKQEIKAAVARAYTAVIVSAENKKSLQGNYNSLKQTLDETRAMFDEGFREEQDVDQLDILLKSTKNQLNQAERLNDITLQMLKYQMGVPVDSNVVLTDSLDKIIGFGVDPSIAGEDFNETSNIDYRIALTNQTVQELNMKNEKALAMPKLNAFFNYRQEFYRNDLDIRADNAWFPNTVWGLSLQVPIFTGFQRHYAIKQSQIELEKANLERIEKREELRLDFERHKSDFEFALDQYRNNKESLSLAKRILDRETIKYGEGVASGLDLAQAQRQFFQSQADYVQSINALIEAKTNLDKILNKY